MAGNHRSGPPRKAKPILKDPITDVSAPRDLGKAERNYWTYYAPILLTRGLWTASARDVLRTYCESLVLRDRLQTVISADPLMAEVVTVDGAGQERISYKPHPLLTQLRQVRLECRLHANDLSLSPMTASKMPETTTAGAADDKWSALSTPRLVSRK
jgi:phage terminase small subunit